MMIGDGQGEITERQNRIYSANRWARQSSTRAARSSTTNPEIEIWSARWLEADRMGFFSSCSSLSQKPSFGE